MRLLVVAMGNEVHRKSFCCILVLKVSSLVRVCRVRQQVLLQTDTTKQMTSHHRLPDGKAQMKVELDHLPTSKTHTTK